MSVFERLAGEPRGANLARLSTATVRAVAQGGGGCGTHLGDPRWPFPPGCGSTVGRRARRDGPVLGIVQVPAVIVTLPAIAWIWSRSGDGTGEALIYTALLLVCGMADNVLKPLMLGRGVDVPMPVILVGALGGMAADGIIGMFVGATLLALAWQLATGWVDENPDANSSSGVSGAASASMAAKASTSRSPKARAM
jgi:hypothetical protein